jgi:UDP-N-acetylglucosamine 2-epimerase (non-hydrolysing)
MKIAPIIDAIKASQARDAGLHYRLVHTGQHYDHSMSNAFFEQLNIPAPDINLEVGSGSQAEQTAAIMTRYEKLLSQERPDVCVVVGDVNSTMACAIVARKLGVPVAHVEGGIRSGDWTMPEEINRVVTDSIANWFFTTSTTANENLRRSGISDDRIFFVGNTMIDTLIKQMPRFRPPKLWEELKLEPQQYFVITLHRPSNVDSLAQLTHLLRAVSDSTRDFPVIFPVHPRTAQHLRKIPNERTNLHFIDPLGYLEFNYLVQYAKGVITDSGGITEETTVLNVPCLTLRNSTERPETVTIGTNELVGTDPANLAPMLTRVLNGRWKKGAVPEKWDGKAAVRIVSELERLLSQETH